jgi:hypothetical protein
MTSLSKGTQKELVRIPNSKISAADDLSERIRGELSKDKTINVAALLRLLREMSSHE